MAEPCLKKKVIRKTGAAAIRQLELEPESSSEFEELPEPYEEFEALVDRAWNAAIKNLSAMALTQRYVQMELLINDMTVHAMADSGSFHDLVNVDLAKKTPT
eukprot:GHVP01015219.1.p1 GENE.GHVP01015219.1~~GHVP01015219.1.p1  ORF type:complete len:102 (+),score=11.20 GHVP01015219.1:227-532(+)